MTARLDPYSAIDSQRQPQSYVEHLETRARASVQGRLRRRFLRFATIARGQRVLEVGSGTGIVAREAAALVGPRGRGGPLDGRRRASCRIGTVRLHAQLLRGPGNQALMRRT